MIQFSGFWNVLLTVMIEEEMTHGEKQEFSNHRKVGWHHGIYITHGVLTERRDITLYNNRKIKTNMLANQISSQPSLLRSIARNQLWNDADWSMVFASLIKRFASRPNLSGTLFYIIEYLSLTRCIHSEKGILGRYPDWFFSFGRPITIDLFFPRYVSTRFSFSSLIQKH